MGYIYQGACYCENCGKEIRATLSATAPEDSLDHSSYDSDNYPKEAQVEREEADSPQHCDGCGVFLHNPLTSDGYRYVQEKLNETGLKSMYIGSMSVALKNWATWYGFTYWTTEDCADDRRHTQEGWYSNEAY